MAKRKVHRKAKGRKVTSKAQRARRRRRNQGGVVTLL